MINQTSKILAIILYLVQIYINFKYGSSIGKISNSLNLEVTPSNWVFSIWLIIYSFQIYMLLDITSNEASKIFIPHAFSVLFNISWIMAFTNLNFGLATIFILGLLASIIYILIDNKTNKTIQNFYSLYFGWISIATFLSATTWIVYTLGITFNQILVFIIYLSFILSINKLNLFTIIPYILVCFDLVFVKSLN